VIVIEWLFNWPGLGRLTGWALVSALPPRRRLVPLPAEWRRPSPLRPLFLISDLFAAPVVRLADPRVRAEVVTHG
jgi:hypothetical protein